MASVEMERFEQTHGAALINDGFDGLNHVGRITSADFGASAEVDDELRFSIRPMGRANCNLQPFAAAHFCPR
jgi:hypothetical protein